MTSNVLDHEGYAERRDEARYCPGRHDGRKAIDHRSTSLSTPTSDGGPSAAREQVSVVWRMR